MAKPLVPPNAKFPPQDPKTIRNDTASTDPELVRARLFASYFDPEKCTREDIINLFSCYGPLRGVSYIIKGGAFAYIQYEKYEHAMDAIKSLNGYNFLGKRLDVKSANPAMQKPLTEGAAPKKGGPKAAGSFNAFSDDQRFSGRGPPNKNFSGRGGKNTGAPGRGGKNFQSAQESGGPRNFQNASGRGTSTGFQRGAGRGGTKNFTDKSTRGKFSKGGPPATGSNALPLNTQKSRQPMPNRGAKKPRIALSENYNDDQYNYDQQGYAAEGEYAEGYDEYADYYGDYQQGYEEYDQSADYQGYENPYGEVVQGGEEQYADGQYYEGYDYGDQAYYEGYDYGDQAYEYAEGEGEYAYDATGYDYDYEAYAEEGYGDEQAYEEQEIPAQQPETQDSADPYAGLLPQPHSSKARFVQKPTAESKPDPHLQEQEEKSIHSHYEVPDMFVCGGCHMMTANPQYFIQHRSKPCKIRQLKRWDDQPRELQCTSCRERFESPWALLTHIGRVHCLYMFSETHLASIGSGC